METTTKNTEKKFQLMYVWAVMEAVLIYAHIFILSALDKWNVNKPFKLMITFLPVTLLVINLIIVIINFKRLDRTVFLGVAVLIKYILIPLYIVGAVFMALCFLLVFSPVVIMVFVAPVVAIVFTVYGWSVIVAVAPYSVAYLLKARKEGALPAILTKIGIVTQFLFCIDVVTVMILAILRERKWVKLTIALLSLFILCALGIGGFITVNIIKAFVR